MHCTECGIPIFRGSYFYQQGKPVCPHCDIAIRKAEAERVATENARRVAAMGKEVKGHCYRCNQEIYGPPYNLVDYKGLACDKCTGGLINGGTPISDLSPTIERNKLMVCASCQKPIEGVPQNMLRGLTFCNECSARWTKQGLSQGTPSQHILQIIPCPQTNLVAEVTDIYGYMQTETYKIRAWALLDGGTIVPLTMATRTLALIDPHKEYRIKEL